MRGFHVPRFSIVIALALMLTGGMPVAAQIATPDPGSLPEAEAPYGLASVTVPGSEEAIESVLAAMPDTVAGEPRGPLIERADRILVSYGDEEPIAGHPMVVSAVAFGEGDFFPPDFTAGDYVAMTLRTSEEGMVSGGRDGSLVWVRAEITVGFGGERPGTPEASETWYTLAWGDIDGGWIFTAIADTPERLEALVVAFVVESGGQVGATVDTTATPPG